MRNEGIEGNEKQVKKKNGGISGANEEGDKKFKKMKE